ncbi:TetR/AcrR family transcriptional regulator [Streptomyces sp. SPB074]|uniref:TetR/AcrR family transcriptional regulator n=1 Tax=Streptomyces sp. (strain SPB074) TaxID=465543 RepID=UPI0001D1DB66|nr:TetR/AcrR family transcriptional regulator [Streptomyces sp. SPB074]EFG65752.1 TetR family transcriptional Regulator [Streptomyces sp. SPB074]
MTDREGGAATRAGAEAGPRARAAGTGHRAARTGRPPLTERRKAATRREIAVEAVRLFGAQGVAATSGDDIARAAGISTRTLWRYFPSKEHCVKPLLALGLERAIAQLGNWPADRPLAEAIAGQDPDGGAEEAGLTKQLITMAIEEPALHAVWLETHHEAEEVFAEFVAARTGRAVDELAVRVQAVIMNGAMRVGAEHWARGGDDRRTHEEALRAALRSALEGLGD